MISDKIKSLFLFVDFLHSNIENFKRFNSTIDEHRVLSRRSNMLSPHKNSAEKLKYDDLQDEIESKYHVIKKNIIETVNAKVLELNICNPAEPKTFWIWNISEINNLKCNFSKEDESEIQLCQSKYLEFRNEIKSDDVDYPLFSFLDRILNVLFDYFEKKTENTKKGEDEVFLSSDSLKPLIVQQSKIEVLPPPQIEPSKDSEVKKTHPNHNPNDWNTACFELFKYLFDEYYNDRKRTKTKLICIWFYLHEYDSEVYILNITKDSYKEFILENYGITLTNNDKPSNYESKVVHTLREHRIKFEDSLK